MVCVGGRRLSQCDTAALLSPSQTHISGTIKVARMGLHGISARQDTSPEPCIPSYRRQLVVGGRKDGGSETIEIGRDGSGGGGDGRECMVIKPRW